MGGPDGMEMVLIDINHLRGIPFFNRVGDRPADTDGLFIINRAAIVNVMNLNRSGEREDARRIDVIGDQFLDDLDVVPIPGFQERNPAVIRFRLFNGDSFSFSTSASSCPVGVR